MHVINSTFESSFYHFRDFIIIQDMASEGLMRASLPVVLGSELVHVLRKKNLKGASERLIRCALLYAGVKLLTNSSKDTRKSVLWIFASTAVLQGLLKSFSWNLSLYFSLRALFVYGKGNINNVLLHPFAIFCCHCVHNNMMVHHAEWMDPSYIRLWLSAIPGYASYNDFVADFSTQNTNIKDNPTYQETQCEDERLWMIPKNMLLSFKTQLPMVTLLYVLPLVLKRKKPTIAIVKDIAIKSFRTSVALTALPYLLTEFPCLYSKFVQAFASYETIQQHKDEDKAFTAKRRPGLHVLLASALSTMVFLAEPKPRLEMIIAYTYWRIIEGLIRKFYLVATGEDLVQSKEQDPVPIEEANCNEASVSVIPMKKRLRKDSNKVDGRWQFALAPIFTGITAALSSIS